MTADLRRSALLLCRWYICPHAPHVGIESPQNKTQICLSTYLCFLLRWEKKRLGAGRLFDKKPRGARHAHRGVGGEGETRTPAPVTRPTPLAGAPRHQLEYFSMVTSKKDEIVYIKRERLRITFWRREWDSNPRCLAARRFSRPFRYDHFGISPCGTEAIITQFAMLVNSFL